MAQKGLILLSIKKKKKGLEENKELLNWFSGGEEHLPEQ